MRRGFERLALSTLLLAGAAGFARAASVEIEPASDNSMYEESGSLSNGSGVHLFSGNTATLDTRRALLSFDIAAALPGGATVTAVTLELTCTQSPAGAPAPQPFTLHRASTSWGEAGSNAGDPGGMGAPAQSGDATWTERFFGMGQPWATAGGEFAPVGSGTASVGGCAPAAPATLGFASTPALVADVQSWLDDPGTNFGWTLVGNEAAPVTARRFSSREAVGGRPKLTIEYEVPPAVPALGPWGGAALVLVLLGASALARRGRG